MSKSKHKKASPVPVAAEIGFLDIMSTMARAGSNIVLTPLGNIVNLRYLARRPGSESGLVLPPGVQVEQQIAGTIVSIAVEGIMPADIANGKYVGCLVIADRAKAEDIERQMRGLPAPTRIISG